MLKYMTLACCILLPAPGVLALSATAGAMNQCHGEAARCMKAGGTRESCQAVVDECMSRHACEEVYLSGLELMEIDENMTESACGKKRAECRKKRGGRQ